MKRILHLLQSAGIEKEDSEELRLQKKLLFFMSGLICIASSLWLLIYWNLGPHLSASLPLGLQVLVVINLATYLKYHQFHIFRFIQLSLLLFFPFVAQWALGDFVSASGLTLWGLLAPVVAILCFSEKEAQPWFISYLMLTLVSGATDYFLSETPYSMVLHIPRGISIIFFVLNFVTVSTLVYISMRTALLLREAARIDLANAHAELAQTHKELAEEQMRSEKLLLNILPASIAHRLKHSEQVIADRFPATTVMFADIVNFTQWASNKTPVDVFSLLNHIFSHFDTLAEKYGLEKIKTIGDAYMVVGGLNDAAKNPYTAVANLALEMRQWVSQITHPCLGGHTVQIRIGMASGAAVAGVVGKNKFTYDVWGDVVNLASRITTESDPGEIKCDIATFVKLQRAFDLLGPEKIPIKGKGVVEVWQLTQRRNTKLHRAIL